MALPSLVLDVTMRKFKMFGIEISLGFVDAPSAVRAMGFVELRKREHTVDEIYLGITFCD